MVIRETRQDRIVGIINVAVVTLVMLLFTYPLYLVVINSFSDPALVSRGKVFLLPQGFTLDAYKMALENGDILLGYGNSLFYLVLGTSINMVLTIPAAYALSKREMTGRTLMMLLIVITMYFGGGLIPTYLVYRGLGLLNTRMAILLSGGVGAGNLIIARSFFASSVSRELEEAAEIDGCNVGQTFLRIVVPLSKAMIFVIMLYYAVARWNNYTAALYYAPSNAKIIPLQLVLRKMLIQVQNLATREEAEAMEYYANVFNQMKYAVILLASLPLLVVYPFIQRFFEKGVMLGSVKG